jgi:hypothetical protein
MFEAFRAARPKPKLLGYMCLILVGLILITLGTLSLASPCEGKMIIVGGVPDCVPATWDEPLEANYGRVVAMVGCLMVGLGVIWAFWR